VPVSLRDQCEGAEARLWPKALGLGFVRRAVLCVRQPRLAVCMGKTQHPLDHFPPRCQRRGTYRCSLTDADAPLRSAPSDCSNAECVHTRAAAPVGRHVPLVARATPMRGYAHASPVVCLPRERSARLRKNGFALHLLCNAESVLDDLPPDGQAKAPRRPVGPEPSLANGPMAIRLCLVP
jgi:hypothetical protein